jgi:hypothetical protein
MDALGEQQKAKDDLMRQQHQIAKKLELEHARLNSLIETERAKRIPERAAAELLTKMEEQERKMEQLKDEVIRTEEDMSQAKRSANQEEYQLISHIDHLKEQMRATKGEWEQSTSSISRPHTAESKANR